MYIYIYIYIQDSVFVSIRRHFILAILVQPGPRYEIASQILFSEYGNSHSPPPHPPPLGYALSMWSVRERGGEACNGNSLLEAHKVISSQAMPQLSICMQWWLSHKVAPGVVDFYCALAVSTPGWCDGGVLQLSELMARPAISRVPR